MGLFLALEPVPEVAHKYPRLVKWDVTKPFKYTLQLIDGVEGQEKVITSTTMEKMFLADYVEKIPVKTGGAEGVLFLPKQRGTFQMHFYGNYKKNKYLAFRNTTEYYM